MPGGTYLAGHDDRPGSVGQPIPRARGGEGLSDDSSTNEMGNDVSGCRHNTVGDFLSLRPALYATGQGEVRFRNFKTAPCPEVEPIGSSPVAAGERPRGS
jgi:hypothetical protein